MIISIVLGLLLALPVMAGELTARQQELKNQIIQIARKNTTNTQNREEVRAQLDALLIQLTRNLPSVDEQTWKTFATGSWKQIWADEENNSAPGIGQNFDRIYQYVNSAGLAVNLGERILPNGQRVTFALKAKGIVSGNVQTTKILEGFFKDTPLLSSMSIPFLANDILNQTFAIFTPTKLGEFPAGPINAQSDLSFSYLDADLKVGTAPNVFSGFEEMFVLVREEIIP
jgi:hypothetical protein